jgi:hypothetical protein
MVLVSGHLDEAANVETSEVHASIKSKVAPVQEGDVLLFQVKLSTEGFPQAVGVSKMCGLQGFVKRSPTSSTDGVIIVTGDAAGSDGATSLLNSEVRLSQIHCGQLQLASGDAVRFCCASTPGGSQDLEAQLVELLGTSRARNDFLGCFSLHLPQMPSKRDSDAGDVDSATTAASSDDVPVLELHGQASAESILLQEVPLHVNAPDLLRLFGKLGGTDIILVPSCGNATLNDAYISFDAPQHIAKFLSQATHTISESGVTQLAHVGPCLQRKLGSCVCTCSEQAAAKVEAPSGQTGELQPDVANSSPLVCTGAARHSVPEMYMEICEQQHQGIAAGQPLQASTATIVSTVSCWRCAHQNIIVPPGQPEMMLSNHACGACIRWPTVVHASSYVVELLNQRTMMAHRFTHAAPEGMLPLLTEMHLAGLEPGLHAACVRCVAPCGCESVPSSWGVLEVSAAPSAALPTIYNVPLLPPVVPSGAPMLTCPAPPTMPPSLPLAALTPPTVALPPIPEEAMDAATSHPDEILTLD